MGIGAAVGRFPFFTGNRPAAFRALLRHHKRNRRFRAQFFHNRQHFRNDFRRFVDDHRVPDADIFFQNEIFVMQCSAAHGAAGQFHRRQHSSRGQNARAAHLDHDVFQFGPGLFRRVFIGDGPAGVLPRGAQQLLLPHRVDFCHRPVCIVGQLPAAPVMLFNKFQDIFFCMGHAPVFRRGETVFFKVAEAFFLRLRFFRPFQVIGKKAEGPAGGHRRIQLAEAACRRVPGIGEFRFPCFRPFFVKTQERGPGHIHLAPHVQQLRHFFPFRHLQPLRDALNGAHIRCNVFANFPVAAGGGPHQPAVFIDQAAGQPVDLRLQHIAYVRARGQQRPHPLVKVPHFFRVIHVAQAQHGYHVFHLGKAGGHIPAGTPRGGIRRHFVGIQGLDGPEPVGQRVVFRVADLRRVQHIILVFMMPDLHAQPVCFPQKRFFAFALFQFRRFVLDRIFFFHNYYLFHYIFLTMLRKNR